MSDLAKVTELNPMTLLERAVTSNVAPEQLSQLMDLQDRWEAKQAQRAFYAALAEFQERCPKIERTAKGHNTKYAKLDAIIETIRPLLRECELTYRWETNPKPEGWVEVTCIITHSAGHSERTSTLLPPDDSGGKNAIQGVGSTNSYGFRYTLIGALGIATADEDKDGGNPKTTPESVAKRWAAHNLCVQANWASIDAVKRHLAEGNLPAAAEAYCEMGPMVNDSNLDTNPRAVLYKSSTRGGIWTVAETKLMRGQEWDELCLQYDQERSDG